MRLVHALASVISAAPHHVTHVHQDATFVRDGVRSSKRSNVSYMKPGPPTPGSHYNGLKTYLKPSGRSGAVKLWETEGSLDELMSNRGCRAAPGFARVC